MTPFMAIAGAVGLTGKAKTIGGYIVAAIALAALAALIGAIWLWWLSDRDEKVIQADRDASTIETQGRVIRADRNAGAAKAARDAATAAEADELRRQADEAYRAGRSPLDAVANGMRAEAAR